MRCFVIWLLSATSVLAGSDKSGDFDYYVMALSWSPNWCAVEGDDKGSEQCDPRHDYGWILHGLWPQYHKGFPSYCASAERPPSRGMTKDMVDIMGSSGLAWHQWKKHGVCSGLSAQDYFELSREAYQSVQRPEIFRKLDKGVKLPASVIEDAWIKDNPTLEKDGLTVTCKGRFIQEVRICLSKDGLEPVPCGQDVVRDCSMKDAVFMPVR